MPTCKNHGELPESAFATRKNGWNPPWCRECERKKARDSRKSRYHDPSTQDLIKSQNRSWQKANSEILSQKFREKYATDPTFRNGILERVTSYRTDPVAHKLKRDRARVYFQENKSEIYKRLRDRQSKHPELKLRGAIRSRVWGALKSAKGGESVLKHLPYSLEDLRVHLERQFEPWMTWQNWGPADNERRTWNIDHIIPQSMFPFASMEEDNFLLCWSLDNLRPLCSAINFSEGNRNNLFGSATTFQEFLHDIRAFGYVHPEGSADDIIQKLGKYSIVDGEVSQSPVGLSYLDERFLHRFSARTGGLKSFVEEWNDDLTMMKAIAYIIKDGNVPTAKRVATNIKFGSQLPSHFFPATASCLVKEYGGGDVFDPFLGWGGRTLGAIAAGCKSLTGTDLQEASVEGCRRVASDCNFQNAQFEHSDFATFMQMTSKTFDIIMTSPPFLATEDYGHEIPATTRSWVEKILNPLVAGCNRILRPGGHVILHGQDRKNVPVLSSMIAAFTAAGYDKVTEYKYGKTAGQSIVVFER